MELAADEEDPVSAQAKVAAARARSRARSRSRNPPAAARVDARDFAFGEILGEGSYSTVMRAKYLATGKEYAIKILDKGHLLRHDKLKTALAEKNALVKLGSGHPGVIRLSWAFHDEWSLCFVLDLANNGELQSRISQLGSLSIECTRYYSAQIVDTLEYVHSLGVIHRDLKPENLLLDDAFRIKITDFGTAKCLESGEERSKTFVGTAQYVAPELLESSESSKSSDLWALGCIIYQMIAGRFAFQALSEYLMWQKIKKLEYSFPDGFDEHARDLVRKILVRDPDQRLGAGAPGTATSRQALRSHPFFASIDWNTLWSEPAPPLEPGLVKKDPSIYRAEVQHFKDFGAEWDELLSNDPKRDTDEMSWASDAEVSPFLNGHRNRYNGAAQGGHEEGPMGEAVDYRLTIGPRPDEEDTATIVGHSKDVAPNDGTSTTSTTTGSGSSSDSSLIENLDSALANLAIERGRSREQTADRGNFQPGEVDLTSILLPGETVVFVSRVQDRSLKRRASILLSLSVAPAKPLCRLLVLTSLRVLCLKCHDKRQPIVTIKNEFALPSFGKLKVKDGRHTLTSVQVKNEAEFVLSTATKSCTYVAEDRVSAATWVRKINDALTASHVPCP